MADLEVKYPDVTVKLTGEDGNAFAVIGAVKKALAAAGVEKSEVTAFVNEAMSGDYDHLLRTCMRWANVE